MPEQVAFCFHSVRPTLAIPPASAWPSQELHAEMVKNLHVEPEWFYEWVKKAVEHWGSENLTVTFDDGFRDTLLPAIWCAQRHKVRTIVFVPTAHIGQLFPYAPYDVIGGQEIAYLAGQGVEIGSHGHQHRDMRRMGKGVVEASLGISKEILDSLTPKGTTTFAPPHGQLTQAMVESANAMGMVEVFGTTLFPAGHYGSRERLNANMDGMRDAGGEKPWPWEA